MNCEQSAGRVEAGTTSVGAVILAAGSASRMGTPKQILQYRGVSLLRRTALTALGAGCRPVIVVTGAHADLSRRELEGLDVEEVLNTEWETGMASTIRTGVESLIAAAPHVNAAVILLCDQPHVTERVVSKLASAQRLIRNPIVASAYGDNFGAPASFSSEIFPELMALRGTHGAKQVIKDALHSVPERSG